MEQVLEVQEVEQTVELTLEQLAQIGGGNLSNCFA